MTVDVPASRLRARRIPAGIAGPVLALCADADMVFGMRVLPAAAWLAVFGALAVGAAAARRKSPGPAMQVLEPSGMAVMWALALFHRAAPTVASAHAGHSGAWLPVALTAALLVLCGACVVGSIRTLGRHRTGRAWLGAVSASAMCAAAAAMLL